MCAAIPGSHRYYMAAAQRVRMPRLMQALRMWQAAPRLRALQLRRLPRAMLARRTTVPAVLAVLHVLRPLHA